MSAFATCCGFYCALISFVGIYYYLVLAIMEYRGNLTLKYIWNVERPSDGFQDANGNYNSTFSDEAPNMTTKGQAFLVLVVVEICFLAGCLVCANVS